MQTRTRGAALLLVLWILALLTGLASVFALGARTEAMQSRALERNSIARYAAEAGVEVAVLRLQGADESQRWIPDGRSNEFSYEDSRLQVRVVDESGKVDINLVGPDVLNGLLLALGVDGTRAGQLTGAIMDWRDPDNLLSAEGGAEDPEYAAAGLPYGAKDRPFETVAELQQVLGMDPATYRQLAPYVTVYSGLARPNVAFAAQPVLQALGLSPDQLAQMQAARESWQPGGAVPTLPDGSPLSAQGTGTYSISSRATRSDGSQAQVSITLRLGGSGGFGQLYTPLSWRVGETD